MSKTVKYAKKTSRNGLIILLAVLIALSGVATALVGISVFKSGISESSYDDYLETAKTYLDVGDTVNAKKTYWQAILLDDTRTEAYERVAEIYEEEKDYYTAKGVYEMAINKIGQNDKFTDKINLLKRMIVFGATADSEENDNAQNSANINEIAEKKIATSAISLNNDFINVASKYTYADYGKKYGAPSIVQSNNSCRVTYSSIDGFSFYYRNSDEQPHSVNITTSTPYESAMPEKIEINSAKKFFIGMLYIIEYSEIGKITQVKTEYGYNADFGKTMLTFVLNNCSINVECDESGKVLETACVTIFPTVQAAETEENQTYDVVGKIIDAVNSRPVGNAKISLSGSNSEDTYTDSTGEFCFENVEKGEYSLTVGADGYIDVTIDLDVEENIDLSDSKSIAISPELRKGEIRFVLEWNEMPRDLDSHLEGTATDGTNVHLYFANREYRSRGNEVIATLDVDDTDGFGPETTTLYDVDGTYNFYIKDFNHTGAMGLNGATVRIYNEDGLYDTVEIDPSVQNIWEVCTIENGKITITNKPLYEDIGYENK